MNSCREVLPHAEHAWFVPESVKTGDEISFTRYFYKPKPLRSLEEIRRHPGVGEGDGGLVGGDRGQAPIACFTVAIIWTPPSSMLKPAYNMDLSPAPHSTEHRREPRRRCRPWPPHARVAARPPDRRGEGRAGEVTGATFAAANHRVTRLAKLGILVEITGYARNRRFRFEPYVRLLSDESEEVEG